MLRERRDCDVIDKEDECDDVEREKECEGIPKALQPGPVWECVKIARDAKKDKERKSEHILAALQSSGYRGTT